MNEHNLTCCAGFTPGPVSEAPSRVVPAFFRMPAKEGRCLARIRVRAQEAVQDAPLFTTHRRLAARLSLAAGETRELTCALAVHPYLPEGTSDPHPGDALEFAFAAQGASVECVGAEPAPLPAVFLMGDSTVTDQGAVYPYAPGATYCGWGQLLPAFLGSGACVMNFARSGLTLETFRTEGLYGIMRPLIRPGDLVLIQFGHNDQKRAHLAARGGYSERLRAYLDDLASLGARCALVTPLARNSFAHTGDYLDLLGPFADAVRDIAAQTGTPLIDLHAFMTQRLRQMGCQAAKVCFHPGDYTHTNEFGAHLAASYVAGQLGALGLAPACTQAEWTPAPPYDELHTARIDEGMPPQGMAGFFASFAAANGAAPLSRIDALDMTGRAACLFAHNGSVALPADIPLAESYTPAVVCALQHDLIPAHFLEDGLLRRHRSVTLGEFIDVLMRGWRMRLSASGEDAWTQAIAAGLIAADADPAAPVTRAQAAAICMKIHI